jgi:hypothetical protein
LRGRLSTNLNLPFRNLKLLFLILPDFRGKAQRPRRLFDVSPVKTASAADKGARADHRPR